MPNKIASLIDSDCLKSAIRTKVNQKFESLRQSRKTLESDWIRIHEAVQEGTMLNGELAEIVGKYTDTKDNSFASLVEKELIQKLAYVRPDAFQLKPKAYSAGTGELVRTDAIEHYLKDKFKSENCKWESAFHDAIYQYLLFNFGVIHYSFCLKEEPVYKQEYKIKNGFASLGYYQEGSELTYQGATLNYVNLFNFYLDNTDHNFSDLYNLDTFYREAVEFLPLLSNDKFNPRKRYVNEAFVIYRNNESLKEVYEAVYQKSDAERDLSDMSTDSTSRGSEHSDLKNYIDLRTCYLKQLKTKDNTGKDLVLSNVIVIYATNNDEIYPLLVEFNPTPFNQKPYIYLSGFKNGVTVYGSSHVARSFSDYALSSFNKKLEVYTAGEAVFGTEYVDIGLFDASTALSEQEFKEAWKTPGYKQFIDIARYREGGGDLGATSISPQRQRAIEVLPLIQQQKNQARQEMQTSMSQIESGSLSDSTAAGVKYQAAQQNLYEEFFKRILADGMRKIIKLTIDDYKKLKNILKEEQVTIDLGKDEIESLMSDLSSGNLPIDENGTAYKQENVGNMPVITAVNQYTKQKFMTLMPWFWDQFDAGIDIKIDGVDSDAVFEQENITRLFDLAEKYQVPKLMSLATQMFLTNMNIPNTDKILQEIEMQLEQRNQPDPVQQQQQMQQMQNEQVATEAKVAESQARAANLQATADEKNINNSLVVQQEQARQQILGSVGA